MRSVAERVYKASRTLSAFHRSDAFVRGIVGPVGSGKSVGGIWEAMRRTAAQERSAEGTAYVRGAIIRNTYRELKDTVLPTWQSWFPDAGAWRESDSTIQIRTRGLHADILFRALDTHQDIRKLLSLELTWAFVNEAREVPGGVVDMLGARVGRYPPKDMGGASWSGVWADTNPPDEMNWWYKQFEEARPDGWEVFRQPSARSGQAENLANLPTDYYKRISAGKTDAWLKVYIDGQYGFVAEDGRAMFPEYQDSLHCQATARPEGGDVFVGLDFGLTPAAVFATRNVAGGFEVHDELVTFDMGASKFAGLLSERLRANWPSSRYRWITTGDPAGEGRSQADENTPFLVLAQAGIQASPASTNDPTIRHDTLALMLRTLTMTGKPGLIISPECKVLRRALGGGYRLKRMNVTGDARFQLKPDKNDYSHVAEACEYMLLGAGQGHNVIDGGAAQWMTKTDHTRTAHDGGYARRRSA